MYNSKAFADRVYRGVSVIVFVGLILSVKLTCPDTGEALTRLGWIAAGMVLCTELAVFIKNYKRDDYPAYELFQASVIPPAVYTCFRYSQPEKAAKALIIAAVIGVIYVGILIKINVIDAEKRKNKRYLKRVIAVGLYNYRSVMIVLLTMAVVYLVFISPFLPLHRRDANELKEWSADRTLAAHYDELRVLMDEEAFAKITDGDERLDIFAAAVDVESNYLGIPFGIEVAAGDLKDDVAAQYSDVRGMIIIDRGFMANCTAEQLIKTCAHECRHAYQHELVRLYRAVRRDDESSMFMQNVFDHVDEYAEEFADYKDGDDDIKEYLAQYCERDSYDYAYTGYGKWMRQLAELEELNASD